MGRNRYLWCCYYLILLSSTSAFSEEFDRNKHFGKGWDDLDGNGLSTREEILQASNISCLNLYLDPYSGTLINEDEVDIDHIISLKDAWEKGAEFWDQEKRVKFKNDSDNLTVSLRNINRSKGDKSFDEWLPPNQYNSVWFLVKVEHTCRKYALSCDYGKLTEMQFKYGKLRKGSQP